MQTLARAQVALGARVRVVCVNHQAPGGNDVTWRVNATTGTVEENDQGVRVTRLGRVASFTRLDVCPGLPATLLELRRGELDIVHVHAPNPTMYLGLAMFPLGARLVITHHSDVVKQRVLSVPYSAVERLIHARSEMVFATSEAYVPGSPPLKRLGSKVHALPLGVELEPFLRPSEAALAYSRELRAEIGAPLWLFVGRLVYYKGLATAIEALTLVSGHLLVVGRGPLTSELRERARALGVANRITWRDYLEPHELVGAYHAATALWFPSNARSEAFGLTQVESMASGCPVLNMNIPDSGVPWVAQHGEEALTSDVDDVRAFALTARRILDDEELRKRLSAGGRARVQRDFDHLVMAKRSLALYEGALSTRARPPVALNGGAS